MTLSMQNRLKLLVFSFFMALLFLGGVLLVGSATAWFPWPNLAGAVVMGVFGLIGTHLRHRIE